jgi:hypothetical protein
VCIKVGHRPPFCRAIKIKTPPTPCLLEYYLLPARLFRCPLASPTNIPCHRTFHIRQDPLHTRGTRIKVPWKAGTQFFPQRPYGGNRLATFSKRRKIPKSEANVLAVLRTMNKTTVTRATPGPFMTCGTTTKLAWGIGAGPHGGPVLINRQPRLLPTAGRHPGA